MSDVELPEGLARHRGFTAKAREVLLEPPAPFAVVTETSGSSLNECNIPKSPHRGFTAKAREMLVERQTHSSRSFLESIRPDFDMCHKQQTPSNNITSERPPMQQTNIGYEKKEILIPHSKLSRIKAHKLLGETGKTRSANEIFYDKCMKRLRNPSLRYDLQIPSSLQESLTARHPDSRRSNASGTAKMVSYTTPEKHSEDISDKEHSKYPD
uniref:Uncharacterized protein n=1 Tax=Elaeophora elaphi TaxID=1147741 RepID=A0A0R3RVE0_9BILA